MNLPNNWETFKVGELVTKFVGGGTPTTSKNEYWNGSIAWMTSAHISERVISNGQRYITQKGLDESATHLVPKNNLLVSTRVGIGKSAVNLIDIAISQDLTGLIINRERTTPEYLYWFLASIKSKLKNMAQGSTIKGILKDDLARIDAPLPPLPEQQRIAEILSTADDAIQKSDEILAKTERLKKGMMQKLLTHGIGQKEFKDSELGRIPKGWEELKVGDVATLEYGKSLPEQERNAGSYPVLGSNGIVGKHKESLVDGPGIVIGRKGSIGKATYIENNFWPIDTTYYVKIKRNDISLKWLFYLLKNLNLGKYSQADVVPGLNRDLAQRLKIPLPPPPEQQKIAEILSSFDQKLELEQKRKAKLERVKRSLMNDLLTGKKRVK